MVRTAASAWIALTLSISCMPAALAAEPAASSSSAGAHAGAPLDQVYIQPKVMIKEVPVPGPVRTIIKEVPGPERVVVKEVVREVKVRVPGPVRTVVKEVPGPERVVVKEVIREVAVPTAQPTIVHSKNLPNSGPLAAVFGIAFIAGAVANCRKKRAL